jgi:hypothetical protein
VCRNGWVLAAYLMIAGAGVAAINDPSPALVQQAGHVITDVWAVFCLFAASTGVVGICSARTLLDLVGSGIAASACFVWGASLVLQAIQGDTATPYTAACAAGALTALFVQRWIDLTKAYRQ